MPSLTENAAADSVTENTSSQVKAILHNGIKAAQAGSRSEARHLLLRVTELEPQNENAWLWLASISEYPEELLIFLNNVLEVNPSNQRALEWMKATKSLLAKTFVQRGIDATKENQKTFAKQCFFQAAAHDDQNEMAWLWLASVSDLAEEKKSYLDKVLHINPENEAAQTAMQSVNVELAHGLVKKATALAAAGKAEEAGALLEEIFQKAPNLEDAWLLKSHLTASFDEKIKCFEKVLEINPKNETALAGLDSFRTIMQIAAPQVHFEEQFAEAETEEVAEDFAPAPDAPAFAEEAPHAATEMAQEAVEETVLEEKVEENQTVQQAEENSFHDYPTDELELPEALFHSNPFEEKQLSTEDKELHEEVDAFFDALEEGRSTEEASAENQTETAVEFAHETEAAEAREETTEQFAETAEHTQQEEFAPQAETEETVEETFQFAEGVENDDFQIVEESAEAAEPQLALEETQEELHFEEAHVSEPAAEDFHTAETGEAQHFAEEAAPAEQPHEEFAPAAEAHEATHEEDVHAELAHEAHEEDAHEANYSEQNLAPHAEESHFEEAHSEETLSESSDEFHAESPAQLENEPAEEFAPAQSFAEETAEEAAPEAHEEAHFEEAHGEVQEEYQEEVHAAAPAQPAFKAQPETAACPYCSTENEVQAFACATCRAVLSLSDLEVLLSNQQVNEVLLHQAVSRMELEKNLRPFDADELLYLGIGYINLKNLRQGFAYLQEAAQMRPDDFLLNSQVNALMIRVVDIKKQEEAHEAQPKGRTILVVDDSATVRKLISGKLEKSGHEVVCAVDGMDALAKLNEIVPDLILLDITMPRMDGYQVCKLIRNNQATKDIPVVMISGKDGFFDKVRGRMAGTTGYITKPFGPETLMKALDAYIKNGGN